MAGPRILVIRRDNIGDLVCTTPLLRALRSQLPDAYLAALVTQYNAAVLARNPDLNAVHSYTKAKHRAEGETLHKAGKHQESVNTLAKAMAILNIKP